jgi:hypothetical protein
MIKLARSNGYAVLALSARIKTNMLERNVSRVGVALGALTTCDAHARVHENLWFLAPGLSLSLSVMQTLFTKCSNSVFMRAVCPCKGEGDRNGRGTEKQE